MRHSRPWAPVVDKSSTRSQVDSITDKGRGRAEGTANYRPNSTETGGVAGSVTIAVTGHRPTCTCNADPVPATVLDIFNGAGTTGLVAARLNRNYIGIELNPEYCELSRKRIEGDAPLLNRVASA